MITNCVVDAREKKEGFGPAAFPAFVVQGEGALSCKRSDIRGYSDVVSMKGSGAKAHFEDSKMTVWFRLGEINENASVEFLRNFFHVHQSFLLSAVLNVSGKIEFRQNELSPTTHRVMGIDKISKKPSHDIANVDIQVIEHDGALAQQQLTKGRSAYTKSFKDKRMAMQRDGQAPDLKDLYSDLYKRCQSCYKFEDQESLYLWQNGLPATPSVKFRHCARCRAVSYCSKECQMKHWPDHRLSCSEPKTEKKTSAMNK